MDKVAFLVCSRVVGGHEFQAANLCNDLADTSDVTVFLNDENLLPVFQSEKTRQVVLEQALLQPGALHRQIIFGLRHRKYIRSLMKDFDQIIVSAGAVEASVAAGVALKGAAPMSLYLPFFYDRRPLWGEWACIYNWILGCFGFLFDRVITINKIQAKLIRSFMHRPTAIVRNRINAVPKAEKKGEGRLLCIGRLDRQKRVPELLAWLDFPGNPYREILIIGDGPERVQVESAAQQLQHIRATLLGWKNAEEQNQLIGADDVLILNSLIEGEPLVIREAKARGIQVVARDIVGVKGLVLNGFKYKNEDDLIRCLRVAAIGGGASANVDLNKARIGAACNVRGSHG